VDRVVGLALNILFEEIKDQRRANKMKAALYKLHGLIETAFPELQPSTPRTPTEKKS